MTDTRRRILDASVALVDEKGARALSFREVARRAGVSHQAPYHHFGNAQGILRAIAAEGFAGLTASMQAAAEACVDALDRLMAAGAAYVAFAEAHPGHFRVMFDQAMLAEDGPLPEGEAASALLARLAADAHGGGHGRGLTAEVLSRVCWSTVHGLAALRVEGMVDPDGARAPEVVVEALGRLLRGDSGVEPG